MSHTLLLMTEETRRPRPAAQYGPTGHTVAENVKRLREHRGMTIYALSGALDKAGRPITPSAIAKIEKQQRQVTVDDLTALASALRVSPMTLLLPWAVTADTPVEVTGAGTASARDVWQWADGVRPLKTSEADPVGDLLRHRLDSRPVWMRSPLDDRYNEMLTESVARLAMFEGKGRVEFDSNGLSVYDTDGRVVRRTEWKSSSEDEPGGDN